MKRAQHIEHCRQILGEGFPEVHDYLDEFHDLLGPLHRSRRHHKGGVEVCIVKWGYMAGAAACLHIWADEVGLMQKEDGTFAIAPIIKPSEIVEGFEKALSKTGYITTKPTKEKT
jgi:hypothetical protein